MSFQDLEHGSQNPSWNSKVQRKQWHHEESSHEQHIKVNIQKMQESARLASELLERAQRTSMSKRMFDDLNQAFERSQELARETDKHFRDWTIHFAGEPRVRRQWKFAYEKLEKAFREEVASLKDARRSAVVLYKKASGPAPLAQNASPDSLASAMGEMRSVFAALENVCLSSLDNDDSTVLARKCAEVTKHVQSQQFVASDTVEIHPAHEKLLGRQGMENTERRYFERFCCALAISMVVMYLMLMHHFHPWNVPLMQLGGLSFEPASMAPSGHQPLILHSWSMG